MSRADAAGWLVAFLLLVLVGFAVIDPDTKFDSNGQTTTDRSDAGEERDALVLRVVDGDTIIVRTYTGTGGAKLPSRRVRYIGVDTPESVKEGTPVQCYGKEAAAENRRLVEGKVVRLVSDRERFDKYDRALAYVYRNGTFVNGELVENGYARTLVVPPNTARKKDLAKLEQEAKRTNKGLWGACDR